MAKNSKIAWCDHTFNPWIGCTKVHTGCTNCYAEELMDKRYGRVKWGPNGERSKTKTWNQPVQWNKEAEKLGVRYKVFCASLSDVFEDRTELVSWRAELFNLIDKTPCLYWLLLTKRPENIVSMWPDSKHRENVWLGTSPCNQKTADSCMPSLILCRHLSPVLFLSAEPLVGNINFDQKLLTSIDWVIFGGESGVNARPCDVNWIRNGANQCHNQGVKVFVKQLGSKPVGCELIKERKGDNTSEWPEDLVIREFPVCIG